jgi:hypothetical protein
MVLKKALAVLAMVVGLSGTLAAVAPSASAIPIHVRIDGDTDELANGICVRINITIFGNTIGTGPEPICLT